MDELRFVRSIGFDLIEINFNHPGRHPSYANAGTWRKEAEKLAVRFTAHAPNLYSLTSLDMSEVEKGIEDYQSFLNSVSVFGIDKVVVHACVVGSKYDPARKNEHIGNLIYALERILPACEKHQICFLLETMIPGRFSSVTENVTDVIDRMNSPWIKLCFDTNHSNLSENINEALRKAKGRIGELHLNDNHGLREEHLMPFEGTIDWDGFSRAVRTIDYDDDMIMEPNPKKDEDIRDMLRKAFSISVKLLDMMQNT